MPAAAPIYADRPVKLSEFDERASFEEQDGLAGKRLAMPLHCLSQDH